MRRIHGTAAPIAVAVTASSGVVEPDASVTSGTTVAVPASQNTAGTSRTGTDTVQDSPGRSCGGAGTSAACTANHPNGPDAVADWRAEMADLITLDQPDDDRRQRLAGAFNSGYEAYARLYRACTVSADEALTRLLVEAEKTARDIHTRYAE